MRLEASLAVEAAESTRIELNTSPSDPLRIFVDDVARNVQLTTMTPWTASNSRPF